MGTQPSGTPGRLPWPAHTGFSSVLLLALMLAAVVAAPAGAQVLSGELLFTSVQPCRIIDTRLAGGPLAANTSRTFHVVGSTSNFTAQGGTVGGCGIPGFVGGKPRAVAAMINIVAVGPNGPGNLRAYPTDALQVPNASVINYANVPGLNIANGLALPLRQDVEGGDLTLRADVSGTHVVADVLGYFTALPLRLASASKNTGTTLYSNTCVNVASVAVTAPVAGKVLVSGTGQFYIVHTNLYVDTVAAYLETTSATCATSAVSEVYHEIPGVSGGAVYGAPFATQQVFTVGAGTTIFYLNAKSWTRPEDPDSVLSAVLTAQFYPD